jgi:hypothetical protein
MFEKKDVQTIQVLVRSPTSLGMVFCKVIVWSVLSLLLVVACGLFWAHAGQTETARVNVKISGEVKMGQPFEKSFGPAFRFHLTPTPCGWLIVIRDEQKSEDISRLTHPFHFVPNPREIEGWHFRNSDNSGPNEAGDKNVNAPGEIREFIFSPEVGKSIAPPEAKRQPTVEEIDRVRHFGHGRLKILDYRLTDLIPGQQAKFEWMRFEVELSWPAGFKP